MRDSLFYQWMMKQVRRHTPVGDLAKDIKRDATFPREAIGLEYIDAYLTSRHACEGAHDALSDAWKSYLRWCEK